MQDNTLVLEILRDGELLKMSLFEDKEASSTLRHYSQCSVYFPEIDKLCADVVSILGRSGRQGAAGAPHLIEALTKSGHILWSHLLTRQVKERLKSTPIQNLILSLDEELINIPWELLYDGSNFLCLNFSLGRLVRTRRDARPASYRSSPGTLKMLILANPTDDLKGAYLEGINIKNQFDRKRSSVHISLKSTSIDKLYVKKNIHDYDIVHFAGHCEYEPLDHRNSGWILSDGRFSVHDIMKMGESESLPSLIFSNACHSAEAGPDLMGADYQRRHYNLASAFLFSGVRHYIGAIRRIEDPSSYSFAREFYHHLLLGSSVGESVRLGRMHLVKEHGISALAWPSYLLYGDPNFVFFRRIAVRKRRQGIKEWAGSHKRHMSSFLVSALVLVSGAALFSFFMSLHPGSYSDFLKAQGAYYAGDNKEAAELALAVINKDPSLLPSYPLLADTYLRMGKKSDALKGYFDYALNAEKNNDKKALADAYIGIGWFYYLDCDYARALDFYNKALFISRRSGDKLNEAAALRKLGVLSIDKKDFTEAFQYLTRSSEINRQRQSIKKHRYNLACDYFDIGLLFWERDDLETAKEFYNKSRDIFERMKFKNELSDYYFNLGEIFLFDKEYDKAHEYYMKGLNIDTRNGNRLSLTGDYNMIGELYLEMGRFAEAKESFRRAAFIAQDIGHAPELALAYYNFGQLYKKMAKAVKARESLRSAQELYKKIDESRYQEIKKEIIEMDGG